QGHGQLPKSSRRRSEACSSQFHRILSRRSQCPCEGSPRILHSRRFLSFRGNHGHFTRLSATKRLRPHGPTRCKLGHSRMDQVPYGRVSRGRKISPSLLETHAER